MGQRFFGIFTSLLSAFLLFVILTDVSPQPSSAQEKHAAPGVDKTKMGPYRALARLAYESFEKGDNATASEIAQILERVWDKSEDYGGDTALSKTNPQLFKQIDKAMDDFITPLQDFGKTPPDAATIKAAYNAYLQKLKLGD